MILFTIFKIIIGILVPLIFGYLIIEAILSKKTLLGFLEKLALAYGVGIGAVSLIMFYLSLLNIKFTLLSIALSLFITALLFLIPYLRAMKISIPQLKKPANHLPFISKFLIGFIVLICGYVLFQALITPLSAWDSWAIYGFKAKAFYLDKGVPLDFFKDITKSYSHPDYPLLVPLSETWFYICLGNWNDQIVKILFPLYFISLLIIFYYNLKEHIDKKLALLLTLFLSTIPQFIWLGSSGYADLPLTFYCLTSVLFLLRAYHDNLNRNLLFISGIFAGLAAWTKNEGQVICLLNIFITFCATLTQGKIGRRNLLLFLQYILIIFLVIAPWLWFKNYLGLTNDVVNSTNFKLINISENLKRLPLILTSLFSSITLFKSWNLIWLLSAVAVILNFKKIISFPILAILSLVVLYLGVWIFIYIVSPYDIYWHLGTSLNRLLMQITPLILFLDGLLFFSKTER